MAFFGHVITIRGQKWFCFIRISKKNVNEKILIFPILYIDFEKVDFFYERQNFSIKFFLLIRMKQNHFCSLIVITCPKKAIFVDICWCEIMFHKGSRGENIF